MRTLILTFLAAATLAASAQQFLTKSAASSNSVSVYFPARSSPMSLVSLDATGDTNTSTYGWAVGTTIAAVVAPVASTNTNFIVRAQLAVSNDTVLVQTTNETVVAATVYSRATNTYYLLSLVQPLETNLAAGDTFAKRGTIPYVLRYPASALDTNFVVNRVDGLATNDIVICRSGGTNHKGTVFGFVTNAYKLLSPRGGFQTDLAIGDTIREVKTNTALVNATLLGTNVDIEVASAVGFATNDAVLVKIAGGHIYYRTVAGTNTGIITLDSALGRTITTNDQITLLTATAYTVARPVSKGDASCTVTSTNGLVAGDKILVRPSSGPLWLSTVESAGAASTTIIMTLAAPLSNALPANTTFYEAVGTYTVKWAAPVGATQIVASTNDITAGQVLYLYPTSGGWYQNAYAGDTSAQTYYSINLTGQLGVALATGDRAWLLSTPITSTIGSNTVRLTGDALFAAPRNRPARLRVTGEAATKVTATGRYE